MLIPSMLAALFVLVAATPPACFLSCTNEVAKSCPNGHADIRCLCTFHASVLGCLVDICPYGNFESARDHFEGTCLEHSAPMPASSGKNPSSLAGGAAKSRETIGEDGSVGAGQRSNKIAANLL